MANEDKWTIEDEDGNEFSFGYWRGSFDICCADKYGDVFAETTFAKAGVRELRDWLTAKLEGKDGRN